MRINYQKPVTKVAVLKTEVYMLSTSGETSATSGGGMEIKGRDQFADDEDDIAAALAEQDNKVDDYGNLW